MTKNLTISKEYDDSNITKQFHQGINVYVELQLEEPQKSLNTHSMVTRSKNGIFKPKAPLGINNA